MSSPGYGSLTGNINWNRGMDEAIATPASTSFAPPVSAPAPAPVVDKVPRTRFWRNQTGGFAGGNRRAFLDENF